MSVIVHTYTKWAVHIPYKVMDENGTEQTVWIVLAAFCATRYMNKERSLVGDRTQLVDRRLQLFKAMLFSSKRSLRIVH